MTWCFPPRVSLLVAFGPSCRRAWVVGHRSLGCSSGCRGRVLGGTWGPLLKPLGGRFETSWGVLGASSGPRGTLWGLNGVIVGQKAGIVSSDSLTWAPLVAVLGLSWAVLGLSWVVLGPPWGLLGLSCGSLGSFLGRLQRREGRKIGYAENVRFP